VQAVTDQNFPESHTDIANKWIALLQAAPEPVIAQAFRSPTTWPLKDAIGLDIVIKGAGARDKQLAEWELMQSGDGPVPDLEATEQTAAKATGGAASRRHGQPGISGASGPARADGSNLKRSLREWG
jgi:hypothetical protein